MTNFIIRTSVQKQAVNIIILFCSSTAELCHSQWFPDGGEWSSVQGTARLSDHQHPGPTVRPRHWGAAPDHRYYRTLWCYRGCTSKSLTVSKFRGVGSTQWDHSLLKAIAKHDLARPPHGSVTISSWALHRLWVSFPGVKSPLDETRSWFPMCILMQRDLCGCVRVQWITETIEHLACTIGRVVQLSQLAFPRETDLNFPWEKFPKVKDRSSSV